MLRALLLVALAATSVNAEGPKNAAIEKVIDLLESLQQQVLEEGEKEAATYNKFACFCNDLNKEKNAAIEKGTDSSAALVAEINQLATKRDELDDTIEDRLKDIKKLEEDMADAQGMRDVTFKEYETNAADLSGAITALEGAIKVLKGSKGGSLVQLQSVAKTVRKAALMADALGLGGAGTKRTVAFFLQATPEVPMQDYDFHSGDIIKSLEKLEQDFRAEKAKVDEEEVQSVASFDQLMQEKTDVKKAKNGDLDAAKALREEKIADIGSNSEELTTVSATLLDDQQYLSELTQICNAKAKTWDQRSKCRADELSALTSAIGIVKSQVAGNTSAATMRLAQQGVSVRLAHNVANSDDAMEAIEASAEAADADDAAPMSFLQRLSKHTPATDDGREAVIMLLKDKGVQLKSMLLTALAAKIAADPFAKIKKLIQELIERLLTEAADEANQKGWCDKATADATQQRTYTSEKVEELNSEMATLEARRNKLNEEIDVLTTEIKELEDAQTKADKERADEKAENEATVKEATAGLAGVNLAIDVLEKFYKTAAKNKVMLMQRGPLDDMPDSGFDEGEAYKGAGGEAGGIIGMLDVIKSDFVRTITNTEKAEAQAEDDHLAFTTETQSSLAEKNMAKDQKTSQRDDAAEKLAAADAALTKQSDLLVNAIKQLLELKPTCVDTGMSYEERVARREDEIEGLKKALCILNAYAEYGPEGAAGAC